MIKVSDSIFSLLGLAQKSNRLVSGQNVVEKAIRKRKVYLVIVSEDASDNTKERFKSICVSKNIPIVFWGTSGELGSAIGKNYRRIIGVIDKGFSISLRNLLKTNGGGGY